MSEKWNIKIKPDKFFKDLGEGEKEGALDAAREGDAFDVKEEHKNEAETRIIEKLNIAIARYCGGLGLPPLSIPPDAIHILSDDHFEEKFRKEGGKTVNAGYASGHIYVPRTDNLAEFIHDLTHEAGHHIASVAIKTEPDGEEKPGETAVLVRRKREGFGVLREKDGGFIGRGLNEGMTEMIAVGLRRKMDGLVNIGARGSRELNGTLSYYPQILVWEELFRRIKPEDPGRARDMMVYCYLTGDERAWKILNRALRGVGAGAFKKLLAMTGKPQSALETARELGFGEAAATIEQMIKEKEAAGE